MSQKSPPLPASQRASRADQADASTPDGQVSAPVLPAPSSPTSPATTGSDLEPAILCQGLKVRYGTRTVLDGIDMRVEKGEVRVILGGSGSGKSTLLKGILGLADVEGRVELLGCNLPDLDERQRTAHLKRIGVMFQNGALFGSLTVGENVALPLLEHANVPPRVVKELVRMKLELVSMAHAEHQYPSELSGGMRKRAALARAMILDPEVLFCDEPSAGLDPLTSRALDDLILNLKRLFGMTVVVVTHELASIEAIADSIIMVGKGKVIAEGPMASVRQAGIPQVDDFFARRVQGDGHLGQSAAELFGLPSRARAPIS